MKPLSWLSVALAAAILAAFLLFSPQDSAPGITADTSAIPKTEHNLDLDVTEDASTVQIWTRNSTTGGFRLYNRDADR